MYLSNLGVNTGSHDGYTLEEAMENIASLGFKNIEIAAVTGWTEHIVPENMTMDDFERIRKLLQSYNLNSHSFSGHLDLGKSYSIERFKKRIDFAEYIGASVINTFTTDVENLDIFLKNIDVLADYASKKNIKIGLENHGDLMNKAPQSVELIERIGHENVSINYDPCNAFLANRDDISISDDAEIICKSGYLISMHIKDLKFEDNNEVTFMGIGKGMVDWEGVTKQIKKFGINVPMSIELELNLYGTQENLAFGQRKKMEEISRELLAASKYIEELLS